MIASKVFLIIAFITGFAYMILGLSAYSFQAKKSGTDKGWGLSPSWAFFPNNYNDYGKRLCKVGKPLFYISTSTCVIGILLDRL